jgi:phenylacetate-CoA ligase
MKSRVEVHHADLRNKHYRAWVGFLKRVEGWSAEEIADYQLREIQRVIALAYEKTAGYRALYKSYGVSPSEIETLENVRRLPLVEKEMIRDNLGAFTTNRRAATYVTTGGSTGIPFGFFRDKVAFARELASKAHQYHRVGWREGDRQLVLRGLPIKGPLPMQFYPRFNELRCSSYHLVPGWMERYWQRALEYKPAWLRCYPSSGYLFARFLYEKQLRFPRLKGILCASENLYDFQKELMKGVFGARVFSDYGQYEMAVLAGFCEHEDTYHVLPQYGYAELIDREGKPVTTPGQIGEIVGTSFIMQATPFIRYRTRDLAVLKGWGCPSCGRPYQIWEKVEGRLQEFVITRAGRYISMTAINMHDNVFDLIKQFQFFQEERGKVIFRFIPRNSCTEAGVANMKERLMAKFGDDVWLTMQPVKEIPPTPRGKHRFLVQTLQLDFPATETISL